MFETYESSDRMPGAFIGVLAGGAVAVLIVGWIYDRLLWWIQDTRLAVLGILLAGGMAAGLWFLGREMVRLGRCRNPIAAMVGAGVVAAVLVCATPWMRYYAERSSYVTRIMKHATEVNAQTLADVGIHPPNVNADETAFADDANTRSLVRTTFSTFGQYRNQRVGAGWNIALFGHPWPLRDWWVVYPVWLIEGLGFIAAAALGARSLAVQPFDENGEKWFTPEEIFRVNSTAQEETYRLARASEFAHLVVLPRPTNGTGYTVRYLLAKPEFQGDKGYLTIQQETEEAGSLGRSNTAVRYLQYWIALSAEQMEELQQAIRDVDSSR